jgi:hypothetical protein
MKKILCLLLLVIGMNAMAQKSGLIYDAHAQKDRCLNLMPLKCLVRLICI